MENLKKAASQADELANDSEDEWKHARLNT